MIIRPSTRPNHDDGHCQLNAYGPNKTVLPTTEKNGTFVKPTNTGHSYVSAQASQHIKLPDSNTTNRRRNWSAASNDYSSLTDDTVFNNETEQEDVEFVRTTSVIDCKTSSENNNKATSSLSRRSGVDPFETSRAQIFRVEYHKRRLSSSSSSSGVFTQNSGDSSSSLENQSLSSSKSESIEETTATETMQKKQQPNPPPPRKPTTLGLAKVETTSPASKTPIRQPPVIFARRPTALLSSPTSTAPPPASVFTTESGETAGFNTAGVAGRRRPTSLFMSERFVPSLSSTTPALYTEAEGSKRLMSMFENSGGEPTTAAQPPHATPHVLPRSMDVTHGVHQQQQPTYTGLGILGAAVRKLSSQQQKDSGFSLSSSSSSSSRYDNTELFSPTARGGTLTATSPNTIQALQSIAELASPTAAANASAASDPIRMMAAAAAAKSVQHHHYSGSSPAAAGSPQTTSVVKSLTPDELASKMTRPRPFLLLDCRSALAFNRLHIIGAANINCAEKSSRKRLQLNRSVSDLISSKETRALFRKRIMRDVIVYDDSTSDISQLPPSDPLVLVISALRSDGKEVSVLSGGFNAFQSHHNHMCEQQTSSAGSSSSSRRQQHFLLPSFELYGSSTPSTPGGYSDASESSASTPSSATLPSTPSSSSSTGFGRLLTAYEQRRRAEEQEPREDDAERAELSQILRGLYLGNERDAASYDRLQQLRITHVVNITTHIPCHHLQRGITYLRLPASDSPRQDLLQHFAEAFDFIDKARREEGNVLVHCQAGISRSATITVSYVMRACGLSMQEAYKLVKQKRSVISPNLNFMGQLYEYEKSLNSLTAAADAAAAALPSSSSSPVVPTPATTAETFVISTKMECDNNGGNGGAQLAAGSSSRPNSGKLSMMVTQSIFEKKPASAVMSPRTSLAAAAEFGNNRHQTVAPERSSINNNKRPNDHDYHNNQTSGRYPSRAVKRPMSLKLSAQGDEDWLNSTKSAPNTLQNEDETEEARRLAFGALASTTTSLTATASGNENLPHLHQSASAVGVTSTNSPTNGNNGGSTPKKIRSPLTPTNDYPTLIISNVVQTSQSMSTSSAKEAAVLPSKKDV